MPLRPSMRASESRRCPEMSVKSPAAYTELPETASARTVPSASGAQSSSSPVRVSNAASRSRETVWPSITALVNEPPR